MVEADGDRVLRVAERVEREGGRAKVEGGGQKLRSPTTDSTWTSQSDRQSRRVAIALLPSPTTRAETAAARSCRSLKQITTDL